VHVAHVARLVVIGLLVLALYFVVPVDSNPYGGPALRVGVAVLLFAALATAVVGQVQRSLADQDRRLDGLICAILGVWVVFALAFHLLAVHQRDQVEGLHTKIDALYFTASTMLTIGYGDVHATGQVARGLVLFQMLFDVVFVATAATTLNAHVRRRVSRSQRQPDPRQPDSRQPDSRQPDSLDPG
jgi:voltage-gated potassium channel